MTGDAATGAEEPIGPVQELNVTLPTADKGRGKLFPRFGKQGNDELLSVLDELPRDGRRARASRRVAKTAAARWGLKALRWTSVKAGVRGRLQRRRVLDLGAGAACSACRPTSSSAGSVVERDLALRAGENWAAGPDYPALDEVDLESVLLHELGHMAGNKKHTPRCANSPMIEALGAGEWWRGSRDKWFGDCTSGARASSRAQDARAPRRPGRTSASASPPCVAVNGRRPVGGRDGDRRSSPRACPRRFDGHASSRPR